MRFLPILQSETVAMMLHTPLTNIEGQARCQALLAGKQKLPTAFAS
jgi:hypothetical protein